MKPVVILIDAVAGQVHLCGKSRAVQCDRHAISSEGRNHGGLIPHTPHVTRASRKVTVRDGRDSQGPLPKRESALQILLQMTVFAEYCREQVSRTGKDCRSRWS